jgi:hypothetical protein
MQMTEGLSLSVLDIVAESDAEFATPVDDRGLGGSSAR